VRIVIDARYINDHFPGIGRYVYNLVLALGELDQPHNFAVLYNPELTNTRYDMAALARLPTLRLVATRQRPFSAGEQLALPRALRSMRADLFHAPYYIRPYAGLPCRSITTLYDIIPRRFPGEVSPRARRSDRRLQRTSQPDHCYLAGRRPTLPPAAARAGRRRARETQPARALRSLAGLEQAAQEPGQSGRGLLVGD
jgi:hypothetical protein